MKISQLDRKGYLSADIEAPDNSDVVVNYAATNVDPNVTTYRVTLAEIGRSLIKNLNLVQYEIDEETHALKLKTLNAGPTAYSSLHLKELAHDLNNTDDEAASTKYVQSVTQSHGKISVIHESFSPVMIWNNAATNVNENKPSLQITVGGNTSPAITPNVATTLLYGVTRLNNNTVVSNALSTDETLAVTALGVKNAIEFLDVSDTPNATQYVSGVSETNGKITVSRANFAPSIILTDGTADDAPKFKITVATNDAEQVTLNKATLGIYGVTKLSNAIDSDSEILAATPKAIKNAIDSLDITQITNTAGKTIATIDEANGKVGATFQDISILSSQISDKGTAGCVATLDANGHVPASQLPSYVDDVLEGTLATFPAEGETGKIYVDITTNTSYRWSGSQYTKVASDLSLGETSATAYRGDYGAAAYAHAVTNKGSAFTSNLYKITTNAEGHVTAAVAAEETDIMALHTDYTAYNSGLYKIAVDSKGHVSAATAVVSNDITPLLGTAATKNVATTGNAAATEVVLGNDTRLTDSRNAADVYLWAKAATKPTYTASEVGALPDDTEIPDITGLAPLEEPIFTTSITIGSTTVTEAQLQALLALLEE